MLIFPLIVASFVSPISDLLRLIDPDSVEIDPLSKAFSMEIFPLLTARSIFLAFRSDILISPAVTFPLICSTVASFGKNILTIGILSFM